MLNYQRVVFLKNCVFSLLLWRHCLYYAMIYIYMICYVILSDFMTFLESLFCCRLKSTFQSQKRGHLMQLTWCCLPGRGTAREMGLQLGLKWTSLQYGNTGSLLMGDVMHMSIIIIIVCALIIIHYYGYLWVCLSLFIIVYHHCDDYHHTIMFIAVWQYDPIMIIIIISSMVAENNCTRNLSMKLKASHSDSGGFGDDSPDETAMVHVIINYHTLQHCE